jgi:hypothetical protein
MKDISYHILDIAQNSIHAGASVTGITIAEDSMKGTLTLSISDNGCGMKRNQLKQVLDPFYTTSTTKKVGLGLPLLKQNAEMTNGEFSLESESGKGTVVTAVFNNRHIDMIPVGDLASTFRTLISANPNKDFVYRHSKDDHEFTMHTAEIRENLDGISLGTKEVLDFISDYIKENLQALSFNQPKQEWK